MDEKKIPWKSEWKAAGLDPGPMTEEELKLVPGLEAENRAFLEKHPFAGKKTAPKSRSLKLQTLFLPLAAAAALLVVFTLPQFAGTGVGLDQERLKGSGDPVLVVYREGPSGAVRLDARAQVRAGDVIQAAYKVTKPIQGAILSVDGEGNVTVHLARDGRSAALVPGGEQPLEFSYELDRAPRFEVFFLLTSDKPFDLEPVRQVLKTAPWDSLGPAAFGPGIRFTLVPLTKVVTP